MPPLPLDVKIATVQAMLDMGFLSFSTTSGEVAERVASDVGDEGLKKLITHFVLSTFTAIKAGRPVRALHGIKCYEDLVKAAENSPRTDASIAGRRGRPKKTLKMNPAVDSSDDIVFSPRRVKIELNDEIPPMDCDSGNNSILDAPILPAAESYANGIGEQRLTEQKIELNEMGAEEFKVNIANIVNMTLGANLASSAGKNFTTPSSSSGRDCAPPPRAKSRPSAILTPRLRSRSAGAPALKEQKSVSFGQPLEHIFPIPPRNAAANASTPLSSRHRRRLLSVRVPRTIPIQGTKITKPKESPATPKAVATITAVEAENSAPVVRGRRCASIVQKIGPLQTVATPKKVDSMTTGFSPAAAKQLEKKMEDVMMGLLHKTLKEHIAPFVNEIIESTIRSRCPDQPAEAAPAQLQGEPVVEVKVEAAPPSENERMDQAFNASGETMMKQMVEILARQSEAMTRQSEAVTNYFIKRGENDAGTPSTSAAGLNRL